MGHDSNRGARRKCVNSKATQSWSTILFFFFSVCQKKTFATTWCLPLTDTHSPCSNDPGGYTEHQQHSSWTDGHEGLHDEARVEVDLIEGAYAAGRSIREQLAVEQHDPADQVESQEHGDGEDDVHVRVGHGRRVGEGQARRPREDVLAGDGVDGTHQELQHDEEDPLVRHGYPPVVRAVVDHKELEGRTGGVYN